MRHGRHIALATALLFGMLLAATGVGWAATTDVIAVSVYLDDSRPAVAMLSYSPYATNVAAIPVAVQFSEPVFDFDPGGIALHNAAMTDFGGSGANYVFTLIPIAEGVLSADIPAGAARDVAGNLNTAAPQFVRIYDVTPPTGSVSINGDAVFTRNVAVSLSLSADDGGGSGVTEVALRNMDAVWTDWETYVTTRAWVLEHGQGYKTVEIRYRDAAGNTSVAGISDTIALDTEPLTLSIVGPNPAYRPERGSHVFELNASGLFGTAAYQWYKEAGSSKALLLIEDATEQIFILDALEFSDSGSYYCEAADETETAQSPAAVLVVEAGLPASGIVGVFAVATAVAAAGMALIRWRRQSRRDGD